MPRRLEHSCPNGCLHGLVFGNRAARRAAPHTGLLRALLLLSALQLTACKKDKPEDTTEPTTSAATSQSTAPPKNESLALLDDSDDCVLGQRGVTIDLGYPAAEARRGFSVAPRGDVEWIVREGSRFGRISSKRISYDIWIDQPMQSVALRGKVRGTGARHLSAYLDDQHLGIVRLQPDKTHSVRFPLKEMELGRGRHRLSLQFLGKPKGARFANISEGELSWLSLSESHPKDTTDTPPTRADTFVNVVLQEEPRRAAALRPRSNLHCPLWVPPDAHLRVGLGLWGQGTGQAEIVVSRDDEPPLSLGVYQLSGEKGWTEIDEPLKAFAGQLVRLGFITHEATEGARIAFGDPRIERPGVPLLPELTTPARRAIVVVMAGLSRKHAPAASRSHGLRNVARFAQRATYFSGYRTPSTLTPATLASLLTGLTPRSHGLEDASARLPEQLHTIPQIVQATSGRAAMFTAVPTSFGDFGFERGWELFETVSPIEDRAATEPIAQARQWLTSRSNTPERQFVVIHLRGGHPPFDVPPERARELPPVEYGGDLDPRRAAIQLASVRARPRPALRRLLDEDWTRLEALQRVALEKQDAALGRLFRWLQDENLWEDAMVVVMGDVPAGEAPEVPFAPHAPLSEERLAAPLLIKWPGGALAGHEISQPVTTVDIATTVLETLRIEVPKDFEGLDLRELASGRAPLPYRPLYATGGNAYVTRAGEWLLRGEFGSVPNLCRLGPDPACVNDLLNEHPLVSQALWKWTYQHERQTRSSAPERTNLELSAETQAALTVWGYLR